MSGEVGAVDPAPGEMTSPKTSLPSSSPEERAA